MDTRCRVGPYEVDPDTNELRQDGHGAVPLEPRTMRVLLLLVERAGQVVSVREILDVVWKDVIVTQDSVYTAIAALRRALGDDGDPHRMIVNVPRRGYRLVAPVSHGESPGPATHRGDAENEATSRDPSAPSADHNAAAGVMPPPMPHSTTGRVDRVRTTFVVTALAALCAAGGWVAWHRSQPPSPAQDVGPPSLAVLPFVDLSERQDQQYFADGLAVEILDELQQIPTLKVIGRESSFQFRGAAQDVAHIGAQLGATYLLEGSMRRVADRVRVTTQLLATRDGSPRWSKTYELPTMDAFRIQDAVATDLARYLQVTIAEVEPERNRMSPEAYDLYLHAIQLLESLAQENCQRGVEALEQAARIDPKSAPIRSSLAIGYGALLLQGWAPPAETFDAAKRNAEMAIQLDPSNGIPHAALGAIAAAYEWDWAKARREMDEAVRLSPANPWVLFLGASVYSVQGDPRRARDLSERLLAIDPLSHMAEFTLGARVLLRHGDDAGAERHLRRAIQIRPEYQTLRYFLAIALLSQNRPTDALAESASLDPAEGRDLIAAMSLHALGREKEAKECATRATRLMAADWPYGIATMHAFQGHNAEALEWLERAYSNHGIDLYMVKGDPAFRKLESDPRYLAFLAKLHLAD